MSFFFSTVQEWSATFKSAVGTTTSVLGAAVEQVTNAALGALPRQPPPTSELAEGGTDLKQRLTPTEKMDKTLALAARQQQKQERPTPSYSTTSHITWGTTKAGELERNGTWAPGPQAPIATLITVASPPPNNAQVAYVQNRTYTTQQAGQEPRLSPHAREDRHLVTTLELSNANLYAIFDGHRGREVAEHCKQHIAQLLQNTLGQIRKPTEEKIFHALRYTIDQLAQECQDFTCGSTALIALDLRDKIWLINVGDSRAALHSQDGITQLTEDQKVEGRFLEEVQRAGYDTDQGYVVGTHHKLGMARSIGDRYITNRSQEYKLKSTPKLTCIPKPASGTLILASDGLWDFVSCEDAQTVLSATTSGGAALALLDRALQVACTRAKAHWDDITVITVPFGSGN